MGVRAVYDRVGCSCGGPEMLQEPVAEPAMDSGEVVIRFASGLEALGRFSPVRDPHLENGECAVRAADIRSRSRWPSGERERERRWRGTVGSSGSRRPPASAGTSSAVCQEAVRICRSAWRAALPSD
jgi:hypothetical protein